MATANQFVGYAEAQRGDAYVWGAETSFTDSDPSRWDCSELTEWCAHRCGLFLPDGSFNQEPYCRAHGTILPVAQAINTLGALLFRISTRLGNHVAISRGDGTTIEARGRAYGVNNFPAWGRVWTSAGLVPGLDYAHHEPIPHEEVPAENPEDDMNTMVVAAGARPLTRGPRKGRTPYYLLVPAWRSVIALNDAPLAGKRHDSVGRAAVNIPPKFGDFQGMTENGTRTGLVLAFADGGTYDIPYRT